MEYKAERKLDEKYFFEKIEERCIDFWKNSEVYKYDPSVSRDNTYIVDTPPPTISGSLHIGHIFSYTQMDSIVRYKRMSGKNIFFPIGWDDNGLPTEKRVQNYYNITCNSNLPYDPDFEPVHIEKNKNPFCEVSRQNFIEACRKLALEDEKIFEDLFRKIGYSYDWDLKYETISKDTIRTSQKYFLDLFKNGYVKAFESPIMWDSTFRSAISLAEIEDREEEGYFHDIEFKVDGEDSKFIISTTRPELLPACIAIVYNPNDKRYNYLKGKNAVVPLFDISVPIISSEHADSEKGTGIMMVCTFGDSADVEWWKNSTSPIKQVIGLDGKFLNVKYGEFPFDSKNPSKAQDNYNKLVGLPIKRARKEIVQLLVDEKVLVNEPRKISHVVKFYEKGELPIEFVTSRQWFVDVISHKDELLKAGNEVKWYPPYMKTRYDNWVQGLNQDWCISRQRFFGVPFPVWYKINDDGQVNYKEIIIPEESMLPIDPMIDVPQGFREDQRGKCGGFIGDKDVMDTWATSSLTPEIAMERLTNFNFENLSIPFDVRPQAHDIIRTWAFYTITRSLFHKGTIPWKEILISGFILDPDRKKMSKSKGNVVTPIGLIEKYSSDAVRYWATKAKFGTDCLLEEQVMKQGWKMLNKFFNSARFVSMILESTNIEKIDDYEKKISNLLDKSWMKKLSFTAQEAMKAFEKNNYSNALEAIEKTFWDFCDNYVEVVKARAYDLNDISAKSSLMLTIDTFAKLFAPFCPFVSEEIFQTRSWATNCSSVHVSSWPKAEDFKDISSEDTILYESVVFINSEIRKFKTSEGVSLKTNIESVNIYTDDALLSKLKDVISDIANVAKIDKEEKIHFINSETLSVGEVELSRED